jgi:glycine/D-amino acid oxidase-like deaminating enzyme
VQKDFIIVGQGLAGTAVALNLLKQGASVMVMDGQKTINASIAAAGMYHPMVFKQLTTCWLGQDALDFAEQFYPEQEKIMGSTYFHPTPMLRVFGSAFEAQDWARKSTDPLFSELIESPLQALPDKVIAPHGAAYVKRAGWLDTSAYLSAAASFLRNNHSYLEEQLEHEAIRTTPTGIEYKDITAKAIIFCEGHAGQMMPALNNAFSITCGDDLDVEIPDAEPIMMNGGAYLIPRGNQIFRLGATYFRPPFSESEEIGKAQLIQKLRKILDCDIKVIRQMRAYRPNIKDRRPLIGGIAGKEKQYVFNGMGSKGVLHAPLLAAHFADHLLQGTALMKEILPSRFLS